MPTYQSVHKLFIAALADEAYEALTNWEIRGQWRKGMEVQWEGTSKAFIGQSILFKIKGFPVYTFSYKITGLEPNYRVYMEYTGRFLKGRCAIEIKKREKGCEVAFHWMKVEPMGVLSKIYFVSGLGFRAHERRTKETLRMLKEYLESKAEAQPSSPLG
jgi:hypothetical protein